MIYKVCLDHPRDIFPLFVVRATPSQNTPTERTQHYTTALVATQLSLKPRSRPSLHSCALPLPRALSRCAYI